MSQFQGFGGLAHPTRMIRDITLCLTSFCTSTVYSYIHMFFNLNERTHFIFTIFEGFNNFMYGTCRGSVPPSRLRTTAPKKDHEDIGLIYTGFSMQIFRYDASLLLL